jgi:hypothetical protein
VICWAGTGFFSITELFLIEHFITARWTFTPQIIINLYVTVHVRPQEALNRKIFPTRITSSQTLPIHIKYPLLTVQLPRFLIRDLFLRKGL